MLVLYLRVLYDSYSYMGYFFIFVPLFRSAYTNNIFCVLYKYTCALAGIVSEVSRYKEIAIHNLS